MDLISNKNIHWDYYIALEHDAERLSRYIEFSKNNLDTYAIELTHLLITAASEVDVVIKQLCYILSPDSKASTINEYHKVIEQMLPEIINTKIKSIRHDLTFQPWSSWESADSPTWWRSYNKVKHERSSNFLKANLGNMLNALSALFVVNVYLNHKVYEKLNSNLPFPMLVYLSSTLKKLTPQANLFRIDDPTLYLYD